jgi:hypothetical protein
VCRGAKGRNEFANGPFGGKSATRTSPAKPATQLKESRFLCSGGELDGFGRGKIAKEGRDISVGGLGGRTHGRGRDCTLRCFPIALED